MVQANGPFLKAMKILKATTKYIKTTHMIMYLLNFLNAIFINDSANDGDYAINIKY